MNAQYMVASLIPEESTLGRAMHSVRSLLTEKGVPFLPPKPKDHISYLPPFSASKEFAEGFAKGLRFCKAYEMGTVAILHVVGHDYFGEKGQALAVELECGTGLKEVVEELRASVRRTWWVHEPDNYLFRPHATIAHDDMLRSNTANLSEIGKLIPKTPIALPRVLLLEKSSMSGKWAVCHF